MLSQGPVLFWPINEQCMIMIQAALYVRSQIGWEQSEYYAVPSGLRTESSHWDKLRHYMYHSKRAH